MSLTSNLLPQAAPARPRVAAGQLRIAAAQFPVFEPRDWPEFAKLVSDWVACAANQGAQLLVFPEYAAMSIAAIFAPDVRSNLQHQLLALQNIAADYRALHCQLAQQYQVHLIAGSFPWQLGNSLFHNRAWLCTPDGHADFQDKRIMTRFEREEWGIAGGPEVELKVFNTAIGRLAINICYDVEFPLLANAQCQAGAQIILAPSCTDTLAGYHRVRIGAQARALENQCFVVQSPLIGSAPWSPAVDINTGAAAIYSPPDRGFPADGTLALGAHDVPAWIYADIDLHHLDHVRSHGQVLNHRDWPEQHGVRVVSI